MKIRMDELFRDIHSDEVLPVDGKMEEEQQKRIEEMIFSEILHNQEKPADKPKRKRANRRKLVTFLLAATLVIAFGVTAGAASENDWDIALMEFMGLDDADTMQWSDGTVQIGASAVCDGTDYSEDANGKQNRIIITATSSIGDQNAAYIRFDTNYELPDDFDPDQDYILPGDMNLGVYRKKSRDTMYIIEHGSTFTSMEENGKLVFMLYISDCPKINKSYVCLDLEDLYLYHDAGSNGEDTDREPEQICEGNWSLNWKYAYRSNVRKKNMLKHVELDNNVNCYITRMEVSPLGVRLEGFVNPLNRLSGAAWMDIEKITYLDGQELSVNGSSTAGCKDGIWLEGYCGIDVLGEVLNVDEVESITIGGCEIRL